MSRTMCCRTDLLALRFPASCARPAAQPMDFSFISQKLAADQYSVPQQLLDDVALVGGPPTCLLGSVQGACARLAWLGFTLPLRCIIPPCTVPTLQIRSNCVLYNGEDSPVTRDCNITMSVFEAAWAEKGLAQYMDEVVSHQHEGTAAAAAAATPAVERPSEAPATAAPAAAASAVLQQGMRSSSRARAVGSVYADGAPAPALAGWVGTAQEALKGVLRMPDAQVCVGRVLLPCTSAAMCPLCAAPGLLLPA